MNKKLIAFTNGIFWTVVIYMSGTVSPLLMFVLVIFTLCVNEDKKVRKAAITAVEIWLIFAVISAIWNIIQNVFLIVVNNMISFSSVYNDVSAIITVAETVCFIIIAGKTVLENTLSEGSVKEKMSVPQYVDKQSAVNEDLEKEIIQESRTNLEEVNTSDTAEIMYCKNCGNKLNPEDAFCMNCGTPK